MPTNNTLSKHFGADIQNIIEDIRSADVEKIEQAVLKLRMQDRNQILNELSEFLVHSNPEIRSQTVEIMILINDKDLIEFLLPIFIDPVDFVRFNFLNELLQNNYWDVRFVEPLIERLLSDTDSDVRFLAAVALGRIGDRRAVPALIHAIETDFEVDYEGESVSSAASLALEQISQSA